MNQNFTLLKLLDRKRLQELGRHHTCYDGTDPLVAPAPPEVMCSLQPELSALHSAAWFNHNLGHSELVSLSSSTH